VAEFIYLQSSLEIFRPYTIFSLFFYRPFFFNLIRSKVMFDTQSTLDWLRTSDSCCDYQESAKPNSVNLFVLHTKFRPCEIKYHFGKNGVQYLFKFKNGYGASVVYHDGSYGLELALIQWKHDDYDLVYNKQFKNVVGYCDDSEIEKQLKKIKKISPKKDSWKNYSSKK
jgi:hypothetical protein